MGSIKKIGQIIRPRSGALKNMTGKKFENQGPDIRQNHPGDDFSEVLADGIDFFR
jgi:hypothetical protein